MFTVDDVLLIDMKVKRVIRVLRVMRVALKGLGPADNFAQILNQALTFGQVYFGEYALAVYAGAACLQPASGTDWRAEMSGCGLGWQSRVSLIFVQGEVSRQFFGMVN